MLKNQRLKKIYSLPLVVVEHHEIV